MSEEVRLLSSNKTDYVYLQLVIQILEEGRRKKNRTGVDTIGIFGAQAKFDVDLNAFPILTTKKVHFKSIVHELLWFIKGDTNIKYLVDNDVHIWDDWAYKKYKETFEKEGYSIHVHGDKYGVQEQGARSARPYTMSEYIARIQTDPLFAEMWGNLGEGTYGGMWRAFPYYQMVKDAPANYYFSHEDKGLNIGGIDQLQKVIDKLKTNPDDRRMIVSAWHPYWVDHCALPPCHCLFHFNTEELTVSERIEEYHRGGYTLLPKYLGKTEEDKHKNLDDSGVPTRRLNCLLYQRSCDTMLGIPYNITSYSLLTAMIAHCVGMQPGVFTHTYGDLHIYENHIDGAREQISRTPMVLPKLRLNPKVKSLFDFKFEDIELVDYKSHPKIPFKVAV